VTRTLLLDLDGTLVHSVPDLASALNRLMQVRGLRAFSEAETALMVGDGVAKLVERAFAARECAVDAGAVAAFSADYGAHAAVETRAYPGVAEGLRSLAEEGWRLAVCTNKLEAAARSLLGALGLAQYFAAIGGGDSFPVRKPDPAHLLATLQAAGGH
jgi:phosphoglycolate phosphatase